MKDRVRSGATSVASPLEAGAWSAPASRLCPR